MHGTCKRVEDLGKQVGGVGGALDVTRVHQAVADNFADPCETHGEEARILMDFFTFGAVDGSFVVYFDGHGHGRIKLHFGQHDKEPEDGFDRIDGCDGLGVTTGKGDRWLEFGTPSEGAAAKHDDVAEPRPHRVGAVGPAAVDKAS